MYVRWIDLADQGGGTHRANLVHLAEVQALEVLERQAWRQHEPVLDVGFTAAEARGVDGERDGLEPGLLGPPHQLLHHLPVLVHLHTLNSH